MRLGMISVWALSNQELANELTQQGPEYLGETIWFSESIAIIDYSQSIGLAANGSPFYALSLACMLGEY